MAKRRETTITFRPSNWQKKLIEQRIALSGQYRKDFIIRSCIYSNIVVVGTKENIKCIVDAVQEMQYVIKEIIGQIQSGNFTLSDDAYQGLKEDYMALAITLTDILNGASYLFDKKPNMDNQHWKAELELEELREVLNLQFEK